MKIAFTAAGGTLEAALDQRFGRASRFVIYDLELGTYAILENEQSLTAAQGAGIQAADAVARSGAQAVVTGHCGPKAFRVLSASGIRVYTTDAPTVAAALDMYLAGKLPEITSATVEGHWV